MTTVERISRDTTISRPAATEPLAARCPAEPIVYTEPRAPSSLAEDSRCAERAARLAEPRDRGPLGGRDAGASSSAAELKQLEELGLDRNAARLWSRAVRLARESGVSLDELRVLAAQLVPGRPDLATALVAALWQPDGESGLPGLTTKLPSNAIEAQLMLRVAGLVVEALQGCASDARALAIAAAAAPSLAKLTPLDLYAATVGLRGYAFANRPLDGRHAAELAGVLRARPSFFAEMADWDVQAPCWQEARSLAHRLGVDDATPGESAGYLTAACLVLSRTASPDEVCAVLARAGQTAGESAGLVSLLAAARAREDGDEELPRVHDTLARIEPLVDAYERLHGALLPGAALARQNLCAILATQLTGGSEQFFVALLSLLHRHAALRTGRGLLDMRSALHRRARAGWSALDADALESIYLSTAARRG